jgi:hypothetical protein
MTAGIAIATSLVVSDDGQSTSTRSAFVLHTAGWLTRVGSTAKQGIEHT